MNSGASLPGLKCGFYYLDFGQDASVSSSVNNKMGIIIIIGQFMRIKWGNSYTALKTVPDTYRELYTLYVVVK